MSNPVKLIALIKGHPGKHTPEEFGEYWLKTHAPYTLQFKNLKEYRINLPITEYQEIEGELPFSGTAELWWDSLEEMQEDFASPEAAAALGDAAKFMTPIHIYTKEYVMKSR